MKIKHFHFQKIDSTNTWAKNHVDQWASHDEVTLITASEQTAGRGRFKRRWESPPNLNIYATFCLWFDLHRNDLGHIPQILALATAETLERLGFSPVIKWPNDVLLGEKKVAGILCETVSENQRRGVICGIGLNINMPEEILKQIDRPATSLFVERGEKFEVNEILVSLQQHFLGYLTDFIQNGFSSFFPSLHIRSAFKKGQQVHFNDNKTLLTAYFEAWNPDGSVELRLINGQHKIFHAGEFGF